ncbi:MAG TPA: metal-dependent hydrolase [Bacteroidales bacterium]|nr:metal-dependent hydrolase [Bacteroidales bacterium]
MANQEKIIVGTVQAVLIRKPIRNIYIRVYPPDGKVIVTVPGRMTEIAIEEFLEKKRDWIIKQHQRLKNKAFEGPKKYEHGEYHWYEGKKYMLEIGKGNRKQGVSLDENRLLMNINNIHDTKVKEKLLDSWYRENMRDKLPALLKKWERRMDLKVSELRIKKMKSKWGSCNISSRRIWLSLELAKYDDSILEYILVHEMVHLLERKHNSRFYKLMDKYLPEWKERKIIISNTLS